MMAPDYFRSRPASKSAGNGSGETGEDGEYKRALRRAMDLLAVREHSVYQLRVKLARKFSSAVVERVIGRLKELELLEDERFAREYIAQRIARSPRSPQLLVNELRQRGVHQDAAVQAVDEVFNSLGLVDIELAEQAAAKKLRTLAGEKQKEKKLKLFRFLCARGFQASVARRVVEKYLG